MRDLAWSLACGPTLEADAVQTGFRKEFQILRRFTLVLAVSTAVLSAPALAQSSSAEAPQPAAGAGIGDADLKTRVQHAVQAALDAEVATAASAERAP